MTRPTSVAVLGSTGSIGTQTIDVVERSDGRFRISAIGANSSVDSLVAQAEVIRPDVVALADPAGASELASRLPSGVELVSGADAYAAISTDADVVVNGVVGFAGLPVTLAALGAGRRLAVANKEALIAAGPVVQPLRATPGAELIPVDSEHCAVHQCLRSGRAASEVAELVLTASGGPFRGRTLVELAEVTRAEALDHPTWSMGPKITIDSSTLMNKGLEVIEAHELFGVDYDRIGVVVHPQSIVHSMVTYTDGATIAQLSHPDMRLPIEYALAWPARGRVAFGAMSWTEARSLDFEPPDRATFRCLDLAYAAGRAGGTAPAWLSAANEVIVEAFLEGGLRWTDIGELDADALDGWDGQAASSLSDVLDADRRGRDFARKLVSSRR